MKKTLRLFACSIAMIIATGGVKAQVPASGTYQIKSASGTYVEVKGKYYAKPDASTTNDYTQIGVGIGYKAGDGYRVFSLSGKNPKDNSSIEVYNYVEKACKIVSEFAQAELNKKLGTLLSSQNGNADNSLTAQFLPALDAMADSICKIYTDDYAFMTLVPQAHYGNKWIVRAKATVPAIPYTIQAVGNYIVVGSDVRGDGHKSTDVWDWAKQHVLKYLDEHQTDASLKALAVKYLDQVIPGTTYYLSYESKDNSFGYETTPSDNGIWTMEELSTTADKLTPGVVNIKNNSTDHYVNVTGKYEAEPNLTLDEITGSDVNKKNTAITLDFGRYDRSKDNYYRITELSNQGQDVVGYLAKGMEKAFKVLDAKLTEKGLYTKIAQMINGKLNEKNINYSVTTDNVSADVKTAVDLCSDYYAYMKLIDNGESVSLRVDVPQVPALLDYAVQLLTKENTTFEDFAKDQISKYFESSETTESLKKLWNQNKDKWHFGHNYYLSAESSYKTFEFTEDASDAAAKWTLAEVNSTSNTNPYQGYYRIKNVGGYNDQQYIDVRGRITADVSATNDNKTTKPGTILYVNMDANGKAISSPYAAGQTVKAYELLNLRSQGIDVMNGCEATTEELSSIFSLNLNDIPGSIRSAYNGYVGFGRYMLTLGAAFADQHIKNYVEAENKEKFDALMSDFNENYLPNLKFQVYLIPVDGKKDTYLVRSMVPSLKPIVDFYKANKTDMDNVVVPAVRNFLKYYADLTSMVGFSGEKFTEDDDKTINSWYSTDGGEWHVKDCCEKDDNGNLIQDKDGNYTLSYSTILGSEQIMFDWLKLQMVKALNATGHDNTIGGYVNMIHYNTPYYLIEGDNHDAQGNRGYTGNAELGFANDGLNAGTAPGGSGSIADDLTSAKDHAYWMLEPVDETNYFTVKPNSHAGKNGKYYSSTYLDFPFEVKGSNVSAVYTVDSKTGVKTKDGNQYVCFNKVSGIIPAATPAIIEFNASTVDNTLALQPVVSDARAEKDQLVQGTFLGGRHRVVENSEGGILSQLVGSIKNANLGDKWGVDTNEKDLYLFGYNTKDANNPYGFYLYSAWSTANEKQTVIPANKPFLIQSENASGAKVYVLFSDGTTTALNNVFSDDAQIPADAPRYNVAGQRVEKDYKGVVIVKGKKYIQK